MRLVCSKVAIFIEKCLSPADISKVAGNRQQQVNTRRETKGQANCYQQVRPHKQVSVSLHDSCRCLQFHKGASKTGENSLLVFQNFLVLRKKQEQEDWYAAAVVQ